MHRMMQSSGTTEGLRGLIDMSLLRSVKKIIEYRGLFGSSILPFGRAMTPDRRERATHISVCTSDQHHGDFCAQ